MIRQCVLRSSLVCIFSAAAEAQTIPQLLISGNGNANPTVATVAIPPQYWQPDTRFQPMVKMSLSAKKNTAGAYIDGPVDAGGWVAAGRTM